MISFENRKSGGTPYGRKKKTLKIAYHESANREDGVSQSWEGHQTTRRTPETPNTGLDFRWRASFEPTTPDYRLSPSGSPDSKFLGG